MDQGLRGTALFRTLILLPFALSFVVTGTVWAYMYRPTGGVLNSFLSILGVDVSAAMKAGHLMWASSNSTIMLSISCLQTITYRRRVRGDTTFREGDKVMQTRNNYQLKWQKEGVFGAEGDAVLAGVGNAPGDDAVGGVDREAGGEMLGSVGHRALAGDGHAVEEGRAGAGAADRGAVDARGVGRGGRADIGGSGRRKWIHGKVTARCRERRRPVRMVGSFAGMVDV